MSNNYPNNFNNNQNNFFNNQNFFLMNNNLNNNNNNFNFNRIQNNFNNNQNLVNAQNNFGILNNNNNISGNNNFNGFNNNGIVFQQNNCNNRFNNFNNNNNYNNNQFGIFNNQNINNTGGFNNIMIMNMGQISNQNNFNFQNNFANFNNNNYNMNNNNFSFGNMNNQVNNMNNFNNNANNNNANQCGNNNLNYLENEKNLSNLKSDIILTYPHLTGLQNIGQTCYMNSTLQCLSNIKEISDYLINNFNIFNLESNPLTTSYINLLFKLFFNQGEKKYIDPTDFKTIIGDLNPLFKGFKAADSKDLLFFLIERLHNEINRPLKNFNIVKDFNTIELESRDENKMLQNFIQEFSYTNNSIISKTFYGVLRTKISCEECKINKYSFQSFNMQIFQLKKLKKEKTAIFGHNNVKLNLIDCFIYSGNEEILDGDNMIYCNNCHKLTLGKTKQDFYSLPKILIIVLNRGKNNADFNEEFDFYENIDFSNQNILLNQNSWSRYYLISIITHLGESGSSGHFIAYVREGISDNFYCYNDGFVSKVKTKDALKQKISIKEDEKVTPYILFYHCYE